MLVVPAGWEHEVTSLADSFGTATQRAFDDATSADDAGGWEVPASALLDRRGVMELQLRQLAELYHAAGTPESLRLHHRCAALLDELAAVHAVQHEALPSADGEEGSMAKRM